MTTERTRIENLLAELRASLSQHTFTCSDDCHAFAQQVLACHSLDSKRDDDDAIDNLYIALVQLAEAWMHDEPITPDLDVAESLEEAIQANGQYS